MITIGTYLFEATLIRQKHDVVYEGLDSAYQYEDSSQNLRL